MRRWYWPNRLVNHILALFFFPAAMSVALPSLRNAIDLFYPPLCLGCGEELVGNERLCPACWVNVRFVGQSSCFLCGDVLPGDVEEDFACDSCLRTPRIWDRGTAAMLYRRTGRDLVLRLKHQDRLDLVPPAAGWMLSAMARLNVENPVLIPVPLHKSRLWKRRYNQSAALAKHMARQGGLDWDGQFLQRQSATPSLGHRTAEERAVALAGTMALHGPNDRYAGRDLVVVDDVMASGATFTESTRVLRAAKPKSISVLSLARVSYKD